MNGGGLNLIGNNMLRSLTLNSKGYTNVPAVSIGTYANQPGSLTVSGNITASNNDPLGSVPSISGGNLALQPTSVITVSGSASTGLSISSPITSGAVTKSGTGTLNLGGRNSYAGPTNITAGTLKITGGAGASGGYGVFANVPEAAGFTLDYALRSQPTTSI